MGIRDRLGRRMRLWLAVVALGWCVFVACLFVERPPAAVMIGAFLATCGALLAMLAFVRCPRCGARLSQIGFAAALAPSAASRYAQCPACALPLD